MTKIFGIGLSRTGTTSFCELMKNLGFKTIHLPFSMEQIDEHTFSNDSTVSARFEELDLRYPNSKFIYTIRNPQLWVASYLKGINQESRNAFYDNLPSDIVRQWISDGDLNLYGRNYLAMAGITKEELLSGFQRHKRRVQEYFKDRPDDLLVIDLTDETSYPFAKVVRFLEGNNLLKVTKTNGLIYTSFSKKLSAEKKTSPQSSDPSLKSVAIQFKIANTWMQLGKTQQAEKSYRKIIELKPDSKDVYFQLSRLLSERNQPTEAIEILRQGVKANPNEAELHKEFINIMERAGKLADAFDYYKLISISKKIEIAPDDILCCVVTRNELQRLPYFLSYYRDKGVKKFFVVDNDSTDETIPYLLKQPDVFIWQSTLSFNQANFGSVWFELLLRKFGKGHWCLTLDVDELLVYPDCENKNIPQLCQELDEKSKTAFSAVLLDMYSDKAIKDTQYTSGQDFLEVCPYFDRKFYHTKYEKSGPYKNQIYHFGGVRQRIFSDTGSYLLSKIALLKYESNFILAGGQHWTNRPESEIAEETGCLLHFKFFSTFINYAKQEAKRKEHYGNAMQYLEYEKGLLNDETLTLYDKRYSIKFRNSQQLVDLGIMKIISNSNMSSVRYMPDMFPKIQPVSADTTRPFWSVMITVYKRTQYLERALKNVLEQAPPEEEMQIEIIQDGTDVNVFNEIESIIRKIGGNRVCFYPASKNYGHPHIFNLCIERARGQWVHILHDDDWVKRGFYSSLKTGIETEPNIGAAFCRQIQLKDSGREHWISWLERETPGLITNWLERIAVMCRLQFSSIVVKREVYEKLGGFFSGANSAFDWDMWKRIAMFYTFWFEPEVLMCSTKDGHAETDYLLKSGQQVSDTLKSIELSHTYLPENIADELTKKARANYARYALDVAKRQLEKKEYQSAFANIREGLRCDSSENVKQILTSMLLQSDPENKNNKIDIPESSDHKNQK